MEETARTIIDAQIKFMVWISGVSTCEIKLKIDIAMQDASLRLVHIPLTCYSLYIQTILKLLFDEDDRGYNSTIAWSAKRPFFNISLNSIECSILCSSSLAEKYFSEFLHAPKHTCRPQPSVSNEEYVVITVEGEGMEAGQRVLDLTTPLAMAAIPIFFITTYFCDYILVPLGARAQVVNALEQRGFIFEEVPGGIDTHVNVAAHHRNRSSATISTLAEQAGLTSPSTPPPASISELQNRTFNLLGKHNIKPRVLSDIRAVQCAGRRGARSEAGLGSAHELALQLGLVKCLAHPPRLMSATFTATEPPAFLLEENVRKTFFSSQSSHSDAPGEADLLIGSLTSSLIPIVLNLEALPVEATGIVCGVASKLAEDTKNGMQAIEISYLSTARTGTVLVEENDLDIALEALDCNEMSVDLVSSV